MKGTKIIFRSIVVTFAVFLFTVIFIRLSAQTVKAAETSSINIPSTYVNVGLPKGLVMLPDGNLWYVDVLNFRIVLFDPESNTILRTVGRKGTAEGEFEEGIYAITRDNQGYLYVLHYSCMVYKLDSNGGFIGKYNLYDADPNCSVTQSEGITYDSYSDSLYITYRDKGTVNKFSKSLVFISSFGSTSCPTPEVTPTPTGLPEEFCQPRGITTDTHGRIYVADSGNSRIQVYSPTYSLLLSIDSWVGEGGGTTDFNYLSDIVILSDGTITASSTNTETIEQFESITHHVPGEHIRTWPHANDGTESSMRNPEFMAKDSEDNIYIGDTWIKAISKYSSTGDFISTLRNSIIGNGTFYFPTDLTYCPDGSLYVIDGTDVGQSRVQEFTNAGGSPVTILTKLSGDSEPYGVEDASQDITCDASGNLWVSGRYHVRIFSKDVDHWDWINTVEGHFNDEPGWGGLGGIAIDGNDVYIPNIVDHDISKYTLNEGSYDYDYSFGGLELYSPFSVVINSEGNLFVADWDTLRQYEEIDGVYEFDYTLGDRWNDFQSARGLSIDTLTDYLYLTDAYGYEVDIYDSTDGSVIGSIGNLNGGHLIGGDQLQFFRPYNSEMNPVTNTLTIADTENSRLQSLSSGFRIINLIPSSNIIVRSGDNVGESLSNRAWDPEDFSTPTAIPARLFFGNYAVADFEIDLSNGDLDWRDVNVQFLPAVSKSLVVNLNPTDAPGISAEHSLYLSRYSSQTSATVCPNATQLFGGTNNAVVEGCNGGYVLSYGWDSDISPVSINSRNYWKIDHLTGTGAFSSLYESIFDLSDVMTRQQINTASSHEITFGTTYDINHIGDTITIGFSADWDIEGSLTVGDLSLYRGGTQLTLGSSAADDIWVASFGTDPNQILFTAPQNVDVSDQAISAGSVIKVIIGGALKNPNTVKMYDINIQILTDSETNNEIGRISVPIVDSDTVNIEGFVTSDLYFDLDTGTGEVPVGGESSINCDYDECQAYDTGDAALNYTVDLGHLNMTGVNKSNTDTVLHSDGGDGVINSIYFDLSTNSASGAVLTYQSLYGELRGPGHSNTNASDLDIPTTNGLVDIEHGVSGYGIQLYDLPVYKSRGNDLGTVECGHYDSDLLNNTYCKMGTIVNGENTQTAEPIYSIAGPIELGRGRIDVAAAIDGTVVPGNYTDEITFIATTIF